MGLPSVHRNGCTYGSAGNKCKNTFVISGMAPIPAGISIHELQRWCHRRRLYDFLVTKRNEVYSLLRCASRAEQFWKGLERDCSIYGMMNFPNHGIHGISGSHVARRDQVPNWNKNKYNVTTFCKSCSWLSSNASHEIARHDQLTILSFCLPSFILDHIRVSSLSFVIIYVCGTCI